MNREKSDPLQSSDSNASGTHEYESPVPKLEENIEKSRHLHRRSNLLHKLVYSAILVILLLVLLLFGREKLAIHQYVKSLQSLSNQLDTFKSDHKVLPTVDQFEQFDYSSRNLSKETIIYRIGQIVPDCPEDTILIHTNILHLRFFTSGCGVILLNGKVQWLEAQDFLEKLEKDQQFYNSQIIGIK